ncbi:MAG: hypothetical protein N3A69_03425 [Leptospiraceae bacterium]|nr:hypothetical protein [Leptospiraceae bacterium]
MKKLMSTLDLEIPDLGDAEEIELVKWYTSVGTKVEEGQELAEITTQKVVFTLESPCKGKILEICVQEGSKVQKGQVVAKLGLE